MSRLLRAHVLLGLIISSYLALSFLLEGNINQAGIVKNIAEFRSGFVDLLLIFCLIGLPLTSFLYIKGLKNYLLWLLPGLIIGIGYGLVLYGADNLNNAVQQTLFSKILSITRVGLFGLVSSSLVWGFTYGNFNAFKDILKRKPSRPSS